MDAINSGEFDANGFNRSSRMILQRAKEEDSKAII